MTPGGVLALDLSLRTGWCYGTLDDRKPVSGVWILPSMHNLGACFVALENELEDAIIRTQAQLVVMEAPLPDVRQTSALLQLGLAHHVESTCYRQAVQVRQQNVNSVRERVLGRGRFPKG